MSDNQRKTFTSTDTYDAQEPPEHEILFKNVFISQFRKEPGAQTKTQRRIPRSGVMPSFYRVAHGLANSKTSTGLMASCRGP